MAPRFWRMSIAFWQPVPAPPTNFCLGPSLQLASAPQSGLFQIQSLRISEGRIEAVHDGHLLFPQSSQRRKGWVSEQHRMGYREAEQYLSSSLLRGRTRDHILKRVAVQKSLEHQEHKKVAKRLGGRGMGNPWKENCSFESLRPLHSQGHMLTS